MAPATAPSSENFMTERWVVRLLGGAIGAGAVFSGVAAIAGLGPTGGWIQLDPAAGVLLVTTGLIGAVSAWLSPGYLVEHPNGLIGTSKRWYHTGFFLFWAVLLAIPITSNLGIAWLLIEASTATSALLVAYSGRRRALEAGWKYLVLTTLGLTISLLGVLYLYAALGQGSSGLSALDWTAIRSGMARIGSPTAAACAALIVAGLAAKVGWAPVHHWLPDAHSEAPAPVSALLSGALLPSVMLVVWRFQAASAGTAAAAVCRDLLLGFGIMSLVIAVPFLWRPLPMKRLLAYSSLEHMGVLALGLGFGTPLALAGAVLHLWGHALAKSTGFYATMPLNRFQPTSVHRPATGIAHLDSGTAVAVGLSLGALSGLPPSPLFFSELLILAGGLATGQYVLATIAAALLALGFVGLAHQLIEALLGRTRHVIRLQERAA